MCVAGYQNLRCTRAQVCHGYVWLLRRSSAVPSPARLRERSNCHQTGLLGRWIRTAKSSFVNESRMFEEVSRICIYRMLELLEDSIHLAKCILGICVFSFQWRMGVEGEKRVVCHVYGFILHKLPHIPTHWSVPGLSNNVFKQIVIHVYD